MTSTTKLIPLIIIALTSLIGLKSNAQDLVVENVTIISPNLNTPLPNQNLLIKEGRIISITQNDILEPNIKRVNATGKFITPGLMDSHAHVTNIPGLGFSDSKRALEKPDLLAAYFQQQPKSFLYHGVTQILDPSSNKDAKIFIEGELHPDLFECGQIPNIGGYPEVPPEAAYTLSPYFIIEDEMAIPLPKNINPADHTPEAVVKRIGASGAICIKIYLEDGFGAETGWPLLKEETLKRLKEAAKQNGLPIIAHANAIDMYQIALKNEIDVLGHGLWNWQWPEEKGTPPVEETLNNIVATKTGYMPTLRVMAGLAEMFKKDNPDFKNVTPQAFIDWYQTPEAQWFKNELKSDFPPDMKEEEIYKIFGYGVGRDQRATKMLADMGHPLLLGSDFPASPSYANQPGLTTYQELITMSEAGISPHAILEAGTINNAQQFGLQKDFGSIEIGKVANLLLLNQNPLENIEAWNDIDLVILRGVLIKRESLKAN